ncbi:MAG: recombinase family protein [Bdellovibrionales bacterium]|nr:recombinase family protein [Bdellovibrionales bacterium]
MSHDWKDNPNKNAFAIIRVSSKKQEANTSHAVQEKAIRTYVDNHDLRLKSEHIFKIVESAKDSDDRTKYDNAIAAGLKEGLQHCLFGMTDREGRNLTSIEQNEKRIKAGKLVVHYVQDSTVLHKGSSSYEFAARAYKAVGDKQLSVIIGEKVNASSVMRAEEGWYPSNRPPKGYALLAETGADGKAKKRGKTTIADPDERQVRWVLREFELRAAGLSLDSIRKQVVAEGIPTPQESEKYFSSAIEKRLKNPFYRGQFVWKGITYHGKHPLIIPRLILDKVDALVGLKMIPKPKTAKGVFQGGFFRCADPRCGCAITYDPKTKKKSGKQYALYRCTNGKKVHREQKNVNEKDIWEVMDKAVNSITIPPKLAEQIADALNETKLKMQDAIRKNIAKFRSGLKQLEGKEDQIFDLLMAGKIDQETHDRQIKRVRDERSDLTKKLDDAELQIAEVEMETAKSIIELAKSAKELWDSRSPLERREFMELLLSNPVLNGKSIEYNLKKPFAGIAAMKADSNWRLRHN